MTPEEEVALLAQVTKMEKQLVGQETVTQQQKTEFGELKKIANAAIEANTDVVKKAELQSTLDKLTVLEDTVSQKIGTAKGNQGGSDTENEPKTLEEMQSALRAAVKSNPKIDETWKAYTDEERAAIWGNPETLPKFIQAASEVPKPVPGSLLEAASDEGGQGDPTLTQFRKQFGLVSKENDHIPGGARGADSGFAGAGGKQQEQGQGVSKRLPNGVIPRPSQDSK